MLRDQPFETYQAGVPEQVRADLALLEVGEVDAVDAAGQQLGQVSLAQETESSAMERVMGFLS